MFYKYNLRYTYGIMMSKPTTLYLLKSHESRRSRAEKQHVFIHVRLVIRTMHVNHKSFSIVDGVPIVVSMDIEGDHQGIGDTVVSAA